MSSRGKPGTTTRGKSKRVAHYVSSSHWDREWYEPFQGFRMRLVSMLDEVMETLEGDSSRCFVMDGQVIPIFDYLEIRPEQRERVEELVRRGRLRIGPWYVLPDEWLVVGESLVRNLQTGMQLAGRLGSESSRAGFVCDQFGHIGQLPQIFSQLGIRAAFLWRGIHEKEHAGFFSWKAPDGTVIPAYRFGVAGYCTFAIFVRGVRDFGKRYDFEEKLRRIIEYVRLESRRVPSGPLLLFDGCDHVEVEREAGRLISRANEELAADGIRIVSSDLDRFQDDWLRKKTVARTSVSGELRESGRDPLAVDEGWLIPGTISSRIRLKQLNAVCEDELLLWAEPFGAFAARLGSEYPVGYLRAAWKHLLENHPHDSICGCSIDQVHRDMIYRFDQSHGISSRLSRQALDFIASRAVPEKFRQGTLAVVLFNPTAEAIEEPVDIEIPLPADWPGSFQEFFGYEKKMAFTLTGEDGSEIPWQLNGQVRNDVGFSCQRYQVPREEHCHTVSICAAVRIPPFGYTRIMVDPHPGPKRYLGSLLTAPNVMENEFFRVEVNGNGTLSLLDKRSRKKYDQMLCLEDRADIGDGWFHGLAVNDRIWLSTACRAEVILVTDGIHKTTFRVSVTMSVPEEFDFMRMERSEHLKSQRVTSDVTLRRGVDRVEIVTRMDHGIRDHRLRVLFPTGMTGETIQSDSAFDVVERPVSPPPDNEKRRELDVETKPHQSWTAFGDGRNHLAVVSRGLPETAVLDLPERVIALTLVRGFRRAVLDNDNPGGQEPGDLRFSYWLVPIAGSVSRRKLSLLGQRVLSPLRSILRSPSDPGRDISAPKLGPSHSFLTVFGRAVVTSVQSQGMGMLVRLFNPETRIEKAMISCDRPIKSGRCVTLDGRPAEDVTLDRGKRGAISLSLPPKKIVTLLLE